VEERRFQRRVSLPKARTESRRDGTRQPADHGRTSASLDQPPTTSTHVIPNQAESPARNLLFSRATTARGCPTLRAFRRVGTPNASISGGISCGEVRGSHLLKICKVSGHFVKDVMRLNKIAKGGAASFVVAHKGGVATTSIRFCPIGAARPCSLIRPRLRSPKRTSHGRPGR
jgi:hypothetical protein